MRDKWILLVEDDQDIRETLQEILDGEGYNVLTAENGEEGLKVLEKLKSNGRFPDLILLDLMMPKMSGTEFRALLRERKEFGRIPVYFMSARSDLIGNLGASTQTDSPTGILTKPIELDSLLSIIEHHWKA